MYGFRLERLIGELMRIKNRIFKFMMNFVKEYANTQIIEKFLRAFIGFSDILYGLLRKTISKFYKRVKFIYLFLLFD